MKYTHEQIGEISKEEWKHLTEIIKELLNKVEEFYIYPADRTNLKIECQYDRDRKGLVDYQEGDIIIRGWDGEELIRIDNDAIVFNGDRRLRHDHESFGIYRGYKNETNTETNDEPYDLFVRCVLVLTAYCTDNKFKIGTENNSKELWKKTIVLIYQTLGTFDRDFMFNDTLVKRTDFVGVGANVKSLFSTSNIIDTAYLKPLHRTKQL